LIVTVAPECTSNFDDQPPPLHLRLHDLHHIAALQSLDKVGIPVDAQVSSNLKIVLFDTFKADLHDIDMAQLVHCLQHAGMTEQKKDHSSILLIDN